MRTQRCASRRRGAVSILLAVVLASIPLGVVVVQDWYVDVNAPACATGTGTQADPFCDIMDAVAAAADGDTIHIAPGTYFENVVLDKDLDLIGTGGEQVTLLDGMASGSVVRVGAAEITLTGLTLTNGSGTTTSGYYLGSGNFGGGLFAYDADQYDSLPRVTLTSCTITGNSAGQGGGIFIFGPGPGDELTIATSTVTANTATGHYAYGGGVCARTPALITSSTISGNTCQSPSGGYSAARGGGIWAGLLTLTDSTVSSNTCQVPYAGFPYSASASGGGIGAVLLVGTRSTVSGNVCQTAGGAYSFARGGGIASAYVVLTASTVSDNDGSDSGGGISTCDLALTDSTVTNNAAARGGGIVGTPCGGAGCPGGTRLSVVNSIVSYNSASVAGGGIDNRGELTITNSTLSGNTSVAGAIRVSGGGASYYYPDLTLTNSIVWNSGVSPIQTNPGGGFCGGPVSTLVEYSLIEGGWPGAGNIDADPLFVDPLNGDFRLMPGSPCIDAGDNLAAPPGIWSDLDGKRRFIDDPLTPDTGHPGLLWPIVDMGPYEFGRDPPKKVRQR